MVWHGVAGGLAPEGVCFTSAVEPGRTPSRSPRHNGTTDVESAVLTATDRLLEKNTFAELTVAQIAREAKISRPTFYYHYNSKYAVIAAAIARMGDELLEPFTPLLEGTEDDWVPLAAALAKQWSHHAPILKAAALHWHELPLLRDAWVNTTDRSIDLIATVIDRQRAAGIARPGLDSRRLASTVVWATNGCVIGAPEGVGVAQAIEPIFVMLQAALHTN